MFLVDHSDSAASSSPSPPSAQLTHTHTSHTQLTPFNLLTHHVLTHTRTLLTHLPTKTTHPHTHTHTQLTHVPLLPTYNLLTHHLPTHDLLTQNLPTHPHTQLTHTQHTHNFAWQAWRLLTFGAIWRGRRGTWRDPHCFRVAGVALMALGGMLSTRKQGPPKNG